MKSISFRNSKSGRLKLPILFGALVWVIALAGLTSGCVFIPTPHYYAVGSRRNVTEHSTNLIQTGADTIEDVMLKLGEPDAVSPDERRIAYGSKKIVGQLFVVGVDTDGSDLPDVTQYRFLNVLLDDKGVVTNRMFSKQQISMLTGSIGGGKIKISFQSEWYPGVDVSKPLPPWGQYRIVSGNLMLTESALYFAEESQWLNEQPALSLRYDSVAECRWVKDGVVSPTLIVRTKDNHFHSFTTRDWGQSAQNTVQSACGLIQSKINPTQPEK